MFGKIVFIMLCFFCCVFPRAIVAAPMSGCNQYKPHRTLIDVKLETPDPIYDLTKTIAEINHGQEMVHQQWLEKNHMESVYNALDMQTQAFTAGGYNSTIRLQPGVVPYDSLGGTACLQLRVVEIPMIYVSLIVVPKDIRPGTCAFGKIVTHELKHHETNKKVAEEYAARLRHDLPTIMRQIEDQEPLLTPSTVEQTVEEVKLSIRDLMDVYVRDGMRKEMTRRNALVDSPEEYARVAAEVAACKK